MANHFNELLLQTLKEISVRLDRLEERTDRIIDQKADKSDFEYTNKRLDDLDTKLDQKADKSDLASINKKLNELDQKADKSDLASTNKNIDDLREDMHSQGQRLDRIEAGIGTLKWIIGAEVAVIGVILAFIKAC